MRGFGTGLGIGSAAGVRYAPAGPSGPSIQNGTFTDATGWTFEQPGAATIGVSGGTLNFVGGSSGISTYAETPVSDVVALGFYTFSIEVTATNLTLPKFSLGGGAEADPDPGTVGANTFTVQCGEVGTNLKIRGNTNFGTRSWSLDNLAVVP